MAGGATAQRERDPLSRTYTWDEWERAWHQTGAGMTREQAEENACHGQLLVHVGSGLDVTVMLPGEMGTYYWYWGDPDRVLTPCEDQAFALEYFTGADLD